MKSIGLILIILLIIGLIFGGLFFALRKPTTSLPFLSSVTDTKNARQTEEAQKIQAQLAPSPIPTPLNNAKFSIEKEFMTAGSSVYVIKGEMLTNVEQSNGIYFADFAIAGDNAKTPIKLILSGTGSKFQFGSKIADGTLSWKTESVEFIKNTVKTGSSVELRVVIDAANTELQKNLEQGMEALLKASEIKSKTHAIQPQMIAVL